MNNESVYAAIIIAVIEKNQKHNGRKQRIWIKQWLKDKDNLGDVKLQKGLETNAEDDLCNFLRMDKECFYELLSKVSTIITKKH